MVPRGPKDWLPLYMVYEDGLPRGAKNKVSRKSSPTPRAGRGRVLQLKGSSSATTGAMRHYQSARPSNESLVLSSVAPGVKLVKLWGKQDASYWSGLVAYQLADQRKRRNYDAAIDYFMNRTLLAYPGGRWTNGCDKPGLRLPGLRPGAEGDPPIWQRCRLARLPRRLAPSEMARGKR